MEAKALMINGIPKFLEPENAVFVNFEKGSKERDLLVAEIQKIREQKEPVRLPLLIGSKTVETGEWGQCVAPHDKNRVLGEYAMARPEDVELAIETVLDAQERWSQIPWYIRLNIFRKAAYLLETKYFYRVTAATMENYSKNPWEAMIDVCELVDFLRFGAYYAYEIYHGQPHSHDHNFNLMDYRPLEGFVAGLPPNNFISIAVNLVTAPSTMGNVCICKPSAATVYAFHVAMESVYEAGLPKDVLTVVHGDSKMIGDILLTHPNLAGVHFTGSTETFQHIWKTIGNNIETYRSYPRLVGETGGKDFVVVYDDDDPKLVAAMFTISGFGYQGRKCSACSRVYMSEAMWEKVKPFLLGFMMEIKNNKVGDVADFRNYMGAIITEQEYKKVVRYVDNARKDRNVEVIGGINSDRKGWFIWPTLIITTNPASKTMIEEIFGPVITICVLDQKTFDEKALDLCDKTSPYGLTGSVATKDVFTLCEGLQKLRYAAGNIYDIAKTTSAIVGEQPFGGSRKSGTDDKAGSLLNLLRWTIPRTMNFSYQRPNHFAPAYLDLE